VPVLYNTQEVLRKVPLVGRPAAGLLHHVFPVNRQSTQRRGCWTLRLVFTEYQSKHTYEQVFRWYEAMGWRTCESGFSIAVGTKPLR